MSRGVHDGWWLALHPQYYYFYFYYYYDTPVGSTLLYRCRIGFETSLKRKVGKSEGKPGNRESFKAIT